MNQPSQPTVRAAPSNFRAAPVAVKQNSSTKQVQTIIRPAASCPHRGPKVGWVDCACQGKPMVFLCRCPQIDADYCLAHAPGKSVRAIHLDAGGQVDFDQEAYRAAPRKTLPVCALCDFRPPQDAERVDILHVTHRRRWQDHVRRSEFAMQAHGLNYRGGEIVKPNTELLRRKILDARPRLVVVHGFATPMQGVIQLAEAMPDRQFMCVNHSSLNHTFTWPQYFHEYRTVLAASKCVPNLHVSAVDLHASWNLLGYHGFRHWPNPIYVPANLPEQVEIDPPCIAIVSRCDGMKALPCQITAAALLQRWHGVRVLISLSGQGDRMDGLKAHAAACGLDVEWKPYADFDAWYFRLAKEISLVLQPSMSDSCNIISIDAAMCGRPFVGSYTIPHTPHDWLVVNPNDPHEIADTASRILADYPHQSERAHQLAKHMADRKNAEYAAMIRTLMAAR